MHTNTPTKIVAEEVTECCQTDHAKGFTVVEDMSLMKWELVVSTHHKMEVENLRKLWKAESAQRVNGKLMVQMITAITALHTIDQLMINSLASKMSVVITSIGQEVASVTTAHHSCKSLMTV